MRLLPLHAALLLYCFTFYARHGKGVRAREKEGTRSNDSAWMWLTASRTKYSNLSLHVTHNSGASWVKCGPSARGVSRLFHTHIRTLNFPGSGERPLERQQQNSEIIYTKILMNSRGEWERVVCRLHDKQKRTLKRKYFMLFKCVLY